MSLQPPHDLLYVLRTTLTKIDADPDPSPSLMDLRHILVCRIEFMEAAQRITAPAPQAGHGPN
jgi:hypothetical protein